MRNLEFEIPALAAFVKHRRQERPTHLYHYTNSTALASILENQELWCGHAPSLSDTQECLIAAERLTSVVSQMIEAEKKFQTTCKSEEKELSDRKLRILGAIKSQGVPYANQYRENTYIASWSEDGNLLSQWRAYCPKGGYSIGAYAGAIEMAAHLQEMFLFPCIYRPEEQEQIAAAAVQHAVDKMLEAEDQETERPHQGSALGTKTYQAFRMYIIGDYFGTLSPLFKHEGFSEEREWRLVAQWPRGELHRFGEYQMHIHPGENKLMRYIKFKFMSHEGGAPFRTDIDQMKINLGPGLDEEWERDSVRRLVSEKIGPLHGVAGDRQRSHLRPVWLQVVPSDIPYKPRPL